MSAQFLYVAQYDLTSGHKSVLLFKEGDHFIPIPSCSTNPNWAVCVDTKGNIGYVPYTYVFKKQVTKEEFLWFIDDVLEKIHADSPSYISKITREVISDLTRRRAEVSADESKRNSDSKCSTEKSKGSVIINSGATEQVIAKKLAVNQTVSNKEVKYQSTDFSVADSEDTPTENSKEIENQSVKDAIENQPVKEEIENPPAKEKIEKQCVKEEIVNHAENSTQTDNTVNSTVPTWLVPTLVENVRCNTQLSHENSKNAVGVVLNTFIDALPHLDSLWRQLKENLKKLEVNQDNSESIIVSEDKRKLLDIFKQLWYCKNDEQQRSWPVHEDEELICNLLVDMNNILMDANPRVTLEVVQCDDYEMVNLLVTYYQMEPRRTLRVKILHVFLTLCELDIAVVTHLLNSVLPTELARDIQDNFEDEEKVQFSSYLLTATFSTGEQPPRGTYDFINKKFLQFLFEKLEEVMKEGEEDVGQNLLNIILAFNLHFHDGQDNLVLETLKERQSAQALTERLVFLLNREEDPTQILNFENEVPNSVLKFMVDLFSVSSLIELFYLNDIKVLLDIIVRQLSDLLPGEKKRIEYLMLVRNLLRNSNYAEHMHQVEGLRKCFQTVLSYEVPEEKEEAIILNIINEFQCWFNGK